MKQLTGEVSSDDEGITMLGRIKKIPARAREFVKGPADAKPILESLGRSLREDANRNLRLLAFSSYDPHPVHETHLAVDNLTNIDAAVRQSCGSKEWIGVEPALAVLDREIERTTELIEKGIRNSVDAAETAIRTLNLLFTAKQKLKQEFGIATVLDLNGFEESADTTKPVKANHSQVSSLPSSIKQMVLSSAMMFQLRQMLFPAERMIVGAACRTDGKIKIEALFDVTGDASPVGVRADADRLAQALIAMSESETYFGLWVHSHPGTGPGATHPSSIDVGQHADWIKDYSPDLVSAIMVKDRYIRFWGTAVEGGKVKVALEGGGATLVSPEERIYRLAG